MTMDNANIPAPIFLIAPPPAATVLLQALGHAEGVADSAGRIDGIIDRQCGLRARLTAADASPDAMAAIREEVAAIANGKQLADASPNNALRVAFLHEVFPDAAFVWVFREPLKSVYDPRDTSPLSPAERALEWSTSMATLSDDLERIPVAAWMHLPYRLVAQYPDQAMTSIVNFLGLKWDGWVPPHRDEPALEREQLPDLKTVEEITARVSSRVNAAFARAGAQARSRPRSAPPNPAAQQENTFRSTASEGFGALLHELGLSLVVSTYQSGFLIAISGEPSGAVSMFVRMFRSPMGIAIRKGQMALGTKTELWDFRNVQTLARQLEPSSRNDACYLPRRIHVTGDIRVHEVGFAGDELWLINTRFSALCTLDAESSFVPRWRPPFISLYAAEDRCHLNGMTIIGDRVRYVSALGTTDTAGGWRANKAGGGVLLDVDSGEPVLRGLSMPHSPRLHDTRFYILESGKGTIANADLAAGRVETIAELPGFTRGLAFAGPYAFVGLSQVRESNIFGGIPLTDRVAERECGIWAIDLRTGQVAGYLRFEGTIHEIFDVQALHGVRYPAFTDLSDKLVVSSFAVPDEALHEFA